MYIVKAGELKLRREEKELSTKMLSEMAGLPCNAVWRMENGQSPRTHPLRAKAVAEALQCKVNDIFTDEKEMSA